ncbi:MAG: hypothetical protein AAGE52_02725 [Myxococcota bacterium]
MGIAVGVLTLVLLAGAAVFLLSGWLSPMDPHAVHQPPPLRGTASLRLELAAVGSFERGDGNAMVERLTALGATAEVLEETGERIELGVVNAAGPEEVLAALQPGRLTTHLVRPLVREAVDVPLEVSAFDPSGSGRASCTALEAWLETANEDGCQYRLEREEDLGEASECVLHCLDPAAVFDNSGVDSAYVAVDNYSGRPVVQVSLREGAAQAFADVTSAHVREKLAIVVDGEVMSAPVIQTPITGGRLQVTFGAASHPLEAHALANALDRGVLPAWTLEAIR